VQCRPADPWLISAGIAYDSSMVDDEDRTPDLPTGEAWCFGLGTRHNWSAQLEFNTAGATSRDPDLINRVTRSYDRRMGR
jgi:long-subunit fatty acid transport protein